ncbi:hypothetical protein BOX37_25930 [Nocardia mangyaensis]|uniref:RloB-like protein n=2 Tax=Nocardia mangyaensis TaxID=2213200 RepID=A0A1J0VXS1_9NOCA|nr:hypothetical protein BOX37_25930 [Nocardia mangyaensis]
MVTNGENTEIEYLKGLAGSGLLNRLVRAPKVAFANCAPGALVDWAIRERERNGYDLVFAVTDKDAFETDSALRKAARHQVRLIVSNPCFESWLVFHFENCRSFLSCADEAKRRLRRYVPEYDKTALRFTDFEAGVLEAVQRTRGHGGDLSVNPTSTMWQLIDELREPECAR